MRTSDDHAHVVVEPRVDDQRLQRLGRRSPLGGGTSRTMDLQDVVDAHAGLGAGGARRAWRRCRSTSSISWRAPSGSACGRSILLSTGHDFRRPARWRCSSWPPSAPRPPARRRRPAARPRRPTGDAADFVGEVHVARGVDQVQVVDLAVVRPCTCSAAVWALMVMPRSRSMSMESSTCADISRSGQYRRSAGSGGRPGSTCRDRCGR